MNEYMEDVCLNCEYGDRYLDFGECPDCHKGRLIGDSHTSGLRCSTGHLIKSVAIPFSANRNCWNYPYSSIEYKIICSESTDRHKLRKIRKILETDLTLTQIYLLLKNNKPLMENLYFEKAIKYSALLKMSGIKNKIVPCIPYMSKFSECFPKLSKYYDYLTGGENL